MSHSIYTNHVLPPDPANFWKFELNKPLTVSVDPETQKPVFTLTLLEIAEPAQKAHFSMWVSRLGTLHDWLHKDKPVVALRTDVGEPMVTFTVRDIQSDVVSVQLSMHPFLVQHPRPSGV